MKPVLRKCFPLLAALLPMAAAAQTTENLVKYVNPIIGTMKMGHTFPGATVPFGMVQLSPDTDTIPYAVNGRYHPDVYKYCAGYQYTDPTIVGFSHTHFSGTGHSDLGDFLVMPTQGKLQLNPGVATNPAGGYRSAYAHTTEKAEPAYYSVQLEDHNIKAELTATNRVGFHKYTFANGGEAHIILDLMAGIYNYDEKNVWTFLRIENDTLITGYRQTNGWARTRYMYFALKLSKPIKSYGYTSDHREVYNGFWRKFDLNHNFPEIAGKKIRAYFNFDVTPGEAVSMKLALSPVSTAGALANLNAEAPHWNFEQVKAEGQARWNEELAKIKVKTVRESDRINFYTSLYHTFLGPTTYMDVDSSYRGLDMNIHQAKNFTNYTTFSLWDTYRALHPFFNLVQPSRNRDMVQSMLAHYDQSVHKALPVWSHHANENWCMIGYHSVSVIADAIVKGAKGIDEEKALEACVSSARWKNYDGLSWYMQLGYVPEDKNGSSVSKTLEYAYDDWCIAQLAKKLGKTDQYNEFIQRAQSWKNVYDAQTGFMRPRLSNGSFRKEFDALQTHGQGFIEGNAWNYSLYVPHQPNTMIAMMGGKKNFARHLDSLFSMELPDEFFAGTEDISRDGIIGNYVHGNEPSHHVVYLYNHAGNPAKTQQKVRMILDSMYRPLPEGLGGNDDCGQMSAWYLFSSMGFYPVAPGSAEYQLGSPLVKEAIISLENGKTFTIEAVNQSPKNVYVAKIELNGKPFKGTTLTHDTILAGGKMVFYMKGK